MKGRKERLGAVQEEAGDPVVRSPLDLWRLKGGISHHPVERGRPSPDSMLAVYDDRVTYTFIIEDEVASIHYDRKRGEIFFRGHNIRHLDLTPAQIEALFHMEEVLRDDPGAAGLFSDYSATLARCLADK